MQLLHLYYFKLLAENEHLLNTAKQIHISPPALSSTISKLESELNVKLFDRVGRNIRLNDNGKVLYTHVCTIFSELDQIKADFSTDQTPSQHKIHVGVASPTIWNDAISSFMLIHPDIAIQHSMVYADQIDDNDQLNRFDLILADFSDIKNRSWESVMITKTTPVLLVNKDHPFAKRKILALSEARGENFIVLNKEYTFRSYFDDCCKKAGFIPKIIAETSYLLKDQLIKKGSGISFSTQLSVSSNNISDISVIPLDSSTPPRILCAFQKKGNIKNPDIQLFQEHLIQYYKDN